MLKSSTVLNENRQRSKIKVKVKTSVIEGKYQTRHTTTPVRTPRFNGYVEISHRVEGQSLSFILLVNKGN